MAKNKGEEEPTIERDLNVTTTHQKGHSPTTPESGMKETTPTCIIKPDPEQSATIPTTTSKNKMQKKATPKSSAATEGNSRPPPPKNSKAKVSSIPMPISWAEAGVADRMLVSMRDNGDDWAKIRKQWKEVTGADTAASTLPTRYSRLKASMMVLADGDVSFICAPFFSPSLLYQICRPEIEKCILNSPPPECPQSFFSFFFLPACCIGISMHACIIIIGRRRTQRLTY